MQIIETKIRKQASFAGINHKNIAITSDWINYPGNDQKFIAWFTDQNDLNFFKLIFNIEGNLTLHLDFNNY